MTSVLDDYQALLRRHKEAQRQHDLKQAEYAVAFRALCETHGVATREELEQVLKAVQRKRQKTLDKYLKLKKEYETRLAACAGG